MSAQDSVPAEDHVGHAPGPWVLSRAAHSNRLFIRESECGWATAIATVHARTDQHQNALLIAAAPDLLALLRELIDIEGPQPGHVEWARRVQDAIDRAEGRT